MWREKELGNARIFSLHRLDGISADLHKSFFFSKFLHLGMLFVQKCWQNSFFFSQFSFSYFVVYQTPDSSTTLCTACPTVLHRHKFDLIAGDDFKSEVVLKLNRNTVCSDKTMRGSVCPFAKQSMHATVKDSVLHCSHTVWMCHIASAWQR